MELHYEYVWPVKCHVCNRTENLNQIISHDEKEEYICKTCLTRSTNFKRCKHCGDSVVHPDNLLNENGECYNHAPDEFHQSEQPEGYVELNEHDPDEPDPPYPDGNSDFDEYAPDSCVPPDTPVDSDE
jgi:hypothetical protein